MVIAVGAAAYTGCRCRRKKLVSTKEAADIVSTAVKRATQRSEELERQANREIADMKQRAEASIEQERKKTINEVKDEIADLSIMIASKVVEREVNAEDHERMIADFISKVG